MYARGMAVGATMGAATASMHCGYHPAPPGSTDAQAESQKLLDRIVE